MDYVVCVWCIWEDGCTGMENVLLLLRIWEDWRGHIQYVVCFLRKSEDTGTEKKYVVCLWRMWEYHIAIIIVGTGVLLIRLFSRKLNHFIQVNRIKH